MSNNPPPRALVRDRPASYRTLQEMIVAASEVVAPPERLSVTEAAIKYVRIKEKNYSGPWSRDKTPYLVEPQDLLTSLHHTGMVFVGPARTGKALPLTTPLATPTGWTTMGDVREGDLLFDEQGSPCRVVAVTPVMHDHDCYRITFDDGTHVDADGGHRWAVQETDTRKSWNRVITTEQMLGREVVARAGAGVRYRYCIGVAGSLQTTSVELPIDPYLLGVWLGDGASAGCQITAHKDDVPHYVRELKSRGFTVFTRLVFKGSNVATISVDSNLSPTVKHFCPRGHDKRHWGVNSLRRCKDCGNEDARAYNNGSLRTPKIARFWQNILACGLAGNKHIPQVYLRASIEQRMDLLRGLMDTDGCVTKKGGCIFTTSSAQIAEGFSELIMSLGIKFRRCARPGKYVKAGVTHITAMAHWFKFSVDCGNPPVLLPRKVERLRTVQSTLGTRKTRFRNIVAIVPIKSVPVRCIQVDSPNHLYLAGRQMVPTHNTQIVLNWLSYSAICDPADLLLIHMTQATGREWSLSDLAKLLRNSPGVRARLTPGRQNDNVHDKSFVSGMRVTIKHPSISELSGKTIPHVWLTDYDRMTLNVDGEGDPWTLGRKRTTTFRRHGMTVAEASPGHPVENPRWVATSPHEAPPAAGILSLYNDGDRRRWHWRCPSCQESFEPDFKLFNYPKSGDPMVAAEQVVMVCPHNGCILTPDLQYGLNLGGRWLGEGQVWHPDGTVTGTPRRSDIASFWLKGPAAAFTTWPELVLKYLNAEADYERTGSEEKLKTVTNTDLGLPYTYKALEAGRLPEELKARARYYGDRGEVPPGVAFLVTTIDVQAGKNSAFVCHTFGICPNNDVYHVDMWKIRQSRRTDEAGNPRTIDPATYSEDWQVLVEEVIERTYPLADGSGRHMAVKIVACDSGGAVAEGHRARQGHDGPIVSTTSNAYDFWRWLRDDTLRRKHHLRFHLVKGRVSQDGGAPDLQRSLPDSQQKDKYAIARGDVPVWLVNSTQVKDQVANLLGRDEGAGQIHFPVWYDGAGNPLNIDWLYSQLTAEVRTPKGWEHPHRSRKNEAFDLLSYCLAILTHPDIRIRQLNWDEPPGWADFDWDANHLVFQPSQGDTPFQPRENSEALSTEDLGKMLGG